MNSQTRKVTTHILDMIADGLLDAEQVVLACLKYMSEDEVADMAHINEFTEAVEDDDQDTWEQSEYEPCPCEVCAAHG